MMCSLRVRGERGPLTTAFRGWIAGVYGCSHEFNTDGVENPSVRSPAITTARCIPPHRFSQAGQTIEPARGKLTPSICGIPPPGSQGALRLGVLRIMVLPGVVSKG